MITYWLLFLLLILIGQWLLDLLLSGLNLKALDPQLPDEFRDIYDQERYRKSQDYTKETTRFSMVENSFTTMVTLLFLLAGGFNLADLAARSFQFGPVPTGLIFTGILMLLSFLVGLPFSIYSTFVLEDRFGFNRTTAPTFIMDMIKSTVLIILIGGPILALILWFFETTGPYAWLYCWVGTVLITFIIQFLAPVLILPLFNTFTPLEDGPLKKAILDYTTGQHFRISGIYTMDGSKRSTKLNAFFTGFGRFRKIVFYDTLLQKLENDEIIAVLAHEMGHFKKKHIWKMMAVSIIQTGFIFFLLSLFLENPGLSAAFSMDHTSVYASLVFFGFMYSPLSTLTSMCFNYLSRLHEFEADRYAAQTTGRPELLIQGLKKLSRENLSNLTPHRLMVFFKYTHPPVLERIKTLTAKHP
ncbi:MAG: peptidase M48 [Proteobacteria bacterium]|nr:MAG: peptidase M48 [Pseudomonadota bacterium]